MASKALVSTLSRPCALCGGRIPDGKTKCPTCGHWQFGDVSTTDGGVPIPHDIKSDGSVLLEDISEAEIVRVDAGLLNTCLDGGLVRSDVVLIGGGPGAGKSTLMLQVAAELCNHGHVMYISAEEDVRAIKLRAKRLGVKTRRRLRLLPALSGVANIGAMLIGHRPNFIIADSLDSLSGRNADEEIVILTVIKKYCVELQAPALIISQINKAGDYAGLKAKQHAVDVLLTFDADTVEKSEPDEDGNQEFIRIMQTIKNRSGRAGIEQLYEMTGLGLVPTLAVPDGDDDPDEDDPD
jgi:DNA repair protein RadA/Sms